MQSGIIFNIQRFSVHDGPGIRTNIFFKGCPLRCAWCHNPEGWSASPEIATLAHRCVGCGACVSACQCHVHTVTEGEHRLAFEKCIGCGKCAQACAYGALELQGKPYTVDEVVAVAMRDKLFYGENGGVTLTGGEPMMQAPFVLALVKALQNAGLHVCMETCGFAKQADYAAVLPYIDRFLFDIKETDAASHKQFTGVDLTTIRENLHFLDENGAETVLRCPIIPDVNLREGHFRAIADLANQLKNVCEIDLEPYHPLGIGKANRIGVVVPYQRKEPLEKAELDIWRQQMATWTTVPVILS